MAAQIALGPLPGLPGATLSFCKSPSLGQWSRLQRSGISWSAQRRRSCSQAPRAALAGSVVPILNAQFGYVAITAAATGILVQWQAIMVAVQRKKSGVKYPQMYEGTEGSLFDCYQRAHMNTLELLPSFLATLLLAGVAYPITASVLGAVFILGRIFYSLGYYTGDPNNRHKGAWGTLGYFGLIITTIVFGVRQLL